TYKDSIYIFGGTIGCNQFATSNFFHYATPPFYQEQEISWKPLSTQNVKSVTDPGCIVDETRGLLFVLGGKDFLNNSHPGFQVYNFNTQNWNEPQNLPPFVPDDLKNDSWGPRVEWLEPGVMFIWGANTTTQGSYLLNLNFDPWQWTIVSTKNTIVPTKRAGVAVVKGNAFIFGGFANEADFSPVNTAYIYSSQHGFLIPQYQLPNSFTLAHGVVGVWNDKLSIIAMDPGKSTTNQMNVVNFDLTNFQFGQVTSAPFMPNITTIRNRASGVQFPWSDSIFIYGGTAQYCGQPILSTWVVYNMSSQTWGTDFNVNKRNSLISNDLTFPKVNNLDLNNANSTPSGNVSPSTTTSNSDGLYLKIIIIVLSLLLFFLSVAFGVVLWKWKKSRNLYEKTDAYPSQSQLDEMASRRL
ncbi:17369_t:CDS:2, partial [Acaulospora morrowiae]